MAGRAINTGTSMCTMPQKRLPILFLGKEGKYWILVGKLCGTHKQEGRRQLIRKGAISS
jgi:hypothetical protein